MSVKTDTATERNAMTLSTVQYHRPNGQFLLLLKERVDRVVAASLRADLAHVGDEGSAQLDVDELDLRGGDVGAQLDLLVGRHDLVPAELVELRCEEEPTGLGLLGDGVVLEAVLLLELPEVA